MINKVKVLALAIDPVYIGTGGYSIGRVDNTIVRDPITKIPKIPATSLAGTWRYYTCLEIHKYFKEDYRIKRSARKGKEAGEVFDQESPKWIKEYKPNVYAAIKCAGQDENPNVPVNDAENSDAGHCGRCLICCGFGFSKKDKSWQGMIFFSDLNIIFFPVFTREGTKWVTTDEIMKEAGLIKEEAQDADIKVCFLKEEEKEDEKGAINLGWLYLPFKYKKIKYEKIDIGNFSLKAEDIILVPEDIFPNIVNSNLEVRTSVSIDPITGAAREGALFTSEAIPRGTVLKGDIRIFDKSVFGGLLAEKDLPSSQDLEDALKASKHFFETLGIGGMTTRGFGRIKIDLE